MGITGAYHFCGFEFLYYGTFLHPATPRSASGLRASGVFRLLEADNLVGGQSSVGLRTYHYAVWQLTWAPERRAQVFRFLQGKL